MRLVDKPVNLGSIYGRWTVIKPRAERRGRAYYAYCRCSCGNQKLVSEGSLRNGASSSCGCFHKEISTKRLREVKLKHPKPNELPPGVAASRALYKNYKYRAKKLKVNFELSETDFLSLTQRPCYYCDIPPFKQSSFLGLSSQIIYNGVD